MSEGSRIAPGAGEGGGLPRGQVLVRCEELLVHFSEFGPLFREVFLGEDRIDWTGIHAESAVDAVGGVDVELRILVISVDAVYGADIDAGLVFDVDAGLSDDMCHVRSKGERIVTGPG